MNEDKPDSVATYCPKCSTEFEYIDGAPRAVCHYCGAQFDIILDDLSMNYPTNISQVKALKLWNLGEIGEITWLNSPST